MQELEVASKRAAKVVQAEKVAIAKARSEEKAAAVGVQAAEARLAAARTTKNSAAAQALVRSEQSVIAAQSKQQASTVAVEGAEARLAAARAGSGKAAAAQAVKAEQALKLAQGQQKVAAQGLQAAEAGLAQARKLGSVNSAAVLQAEQQLAIARGRHETTGLKVVAVEDQLKAAFTEQKTITTQLGDAQAQSAKQTALMNSRFGRLAAAGAPLSSGLGKVAVGAKNVAASALSTLKPLAGMAAGFGAIIGAGQVIKLGNEYTATMNELGAVTNTSGAELAKFGIKARELGSDLTLPATSGKDAAAVMLELAKGGLTASEAMDAAKGTITLAAAAQVDGARAAEIQANALNQFGLKAKDAAMVADVLANTANAAAGGVDDIALSMKYVGPVARTMGINLADTAAAVGILANNGLKGDTAGTALRGMLASLARPSKQAQKAVDALNLSVFDQQGKFVGLRAVIESLSEARRTMTQEDFASQAVLAFGREPLAAVTSLAASGAPAFDKMGKSVSRTGGAAAVAQSKMKGLGGAMDKLQSQLEDVALGIYQTVTPALEGIANGAAKGLDGAGSKVTNFLDLMGGLGKLAVTGKVSLGLTATTNFVPDSPQVKSILAARQVVIDALNDVRTFVTTALVPSFKNLLVAIGPVAAIIGGAFLVAFRAAAAALRLIGPGLVAVTGFMRDHKAVAIVAAAAIGYLIVAYQVAQIRLAVLNGTLTTAIRKTTLFKTAALVASAAQAGWNGAMLVGKSVAFAFTAATRGMAAAQVAFNIAASANPLGLLILGITAVVVAIAALVAGVIWAYKNIDWFRNAVNAVWTGIITGAKAVGAAAVWLWQTVFVPAWQGIAAAAMWTWNTVLKPVFSGIMTVVRAVGAVFTWWWQNVTMPVFRGIAAVAGWFGNTISAIFDLVIAMVKFALAPVFNFVAQVAKVAFAAIVAGVRWWWGLTSTVFNIAVVFLRGTLGDAFTWVSSIVRIAFAAISAVTSAWWARVRVIFAATSAYIRGTLGPVFTWLNRSIIAPAMTGIRVAVGALWSWLKPVFDKLATVAKVTIPAAFGVMKNSIGKAWEAIKTAAKLPIRFVVETVINKALIGNFNKVAGFFGTKKIDPISLPKGFARGGVIPGYQAAKRDDVMTPMRRGEGVLVPEVVRGLGPSTVHALNAAGNSGGASAVRKMTGYAKGGVVKKSSGSDGGNGNGLLSGAKAAWNWTKGAAGAAWDWTKNAAETASQVVSDPMGTLGKLVKSVIGNIPGAGGMVDAAAGMGNKLLSGAVSVLKNMGGAGDVGNFGGSGANGQLPKSALSKVSGFTGGPGVGPIGGYLRKAAAVAWEAMQRAFGGGLSLTEGYRDLANQQMRYSAYRAGRGNLAAAPGTSVHGYGLAADVGGGSQAWMRANGPRFGWYPTGLSFAQREPWHFEYKGGKAAGGMAAGGIVGGLTPTLYDKGGVLPQGLSLVQNNLRDPEVALPMQTLREIVSTESGGGGTTYAPVFHNPDRGAVREFESWVHKKEVMAGGR
ncbi:phage tail tape measure protein [Curtobacterium flaccumfaciens]|uniref:phage tail tape measure protein n=1 Tax=Curtobacterium flaccumfaciens TaxID=2035 RepID=UPI001ADCF318|nr:phage tail tape measure protein [Curtobacterium flaccumfaciens]MBO9043461.1 phage tail tape measure protein [Curtobacterium flaccumfaciens pv. flaccumfaciens]